MKDWKTDEPGLVRRAAAILAEELADRGATRADASHAIEAGESAIAMNPWPYEWSTPTTPKERAAFAVGRALLRLQWTEGLPIDTPFSSNGPALIRFLLQNKEK